jgi:hypothetical protein
VINDSLADDNSSSIKDEPMTLDEAFNLAGGFGKLYDIIMDIRKISSFNDDFHFIGVLLWEPFNICNCLIDITASISM